MKATVNATDLHALQIATLRAEIAVRDAEIAKLKIFVRHGLVEGDSFDQGTGEIHRATPMEVRDG